MVCGMMNLSSGVTLTRPGELLLYFSDISVIALVVVRRVCVVYFEFEVNLTFSSK